MHDVLVHMIVCSGAPGHIMRNFPHRGVGGVAQRIRSIVSLTSSTLSLGRGLQMPTGRGRKARGFY